MAAGRAKPMVASPFEIKTSFGADARQNAVAPGGLHFERSTTEFDHRHIKGTAAEVVHGYSAVCVPSRAECQSRCGWLVDNANDFYFS